MGRKIGSVEMCFGLYLLKRANSPKASCSSFTSQSSLSCFNKDSDVMLWHYRLGHPNFMYLEKLFPSLFINKSPKLFNCEICQLAKHSRSTYSPLSYKPFKPFSMIHSDVWGPSKTKNITGTRWFVSLIDDHTRLTWVFLMKEKSESISIF